MGFPKTENKARIFTLTIQIQYTAGYPNQCNKAVKRCKSTWIKNQEIKPSLFAGEK